MRGTSRGVLARKGAKALANGSTTSGTEDRSAPELLCSPHPPSTPSESDRPAPFAPRRGNPGSVQRRFRMQKMGAVSNRLHLCTSKELGRKGQRAREHARLLHVFNTAGQLSGATCN